MADEQELTHLPDLYAEHLGFGLPEDATWVGMGVATDTTLAKVYLPTLQAVEIASMWLGMAQQQAFRLPMERLRENAARQAEAEPNEAVEAVDVRFDAQAGVLEIHVGIGMMRFTVEKDRLATLAQALLHFKE